MKRIIFFMCILMSILFINAANQGMIFQVKNETVTLKGYVETEFSGRVNANFFDEVNLSLASNILCAEVNITQGNSSKIYKENCTLSINIVRDIPLIFNESKNTIIGDSELQRKYEECLTLKSQFDAGLNGCLRSKIEQGEYKENFTLCSTNLIVCQNDKTNVESKIGDLEKFKEDNKNQHWIWGIGGGVLVGLIFLFKEGKIFGPSRKGVSENFNDRQAM